VLVTEDIDNFAKADQSAALLKELRYTDSGSTIKNQHTSGL